MPLQPPSPEFLSQVPVPEVESTKSTNSMGETGSGAAGLDWRRRAELAGVGVVLLAAAFGVGDLIS